MLKLNLLPWREELKKERETRFAVITVFCLACTGGIVFGIHTYMENWITYQNSRNSYLEGEIKRAQEANKSIATLELEREKLYARMKVIHTLQSNRSEIVHLFDEVAHRLPAGVYFTSLSQRGNKVKVLGMAQSNARITRLIRQYGESEWLTKPTLGRITAVKKGKRQKKFSKFEINFQQKTPKKEEDTE